MDTEFDRNPAFRLSVLYLIFALLSFFLCLLGERELRIVDIPDICIVIMG